MAKKTTTPPATLASTSAAVSKAKPKSATKPPATTAAASPKTATSKRASPKTAKAGATPSSAAAKGHRPVPIGSTAPKVKAYKAKSGVKRKKAAAPAQLPNPAVELQAAAPARAPKSKKVPKSKQGGRNLFCNKCGHQHGPIANNVGFVLVAIARHGKPCPDQACGGELKARPLGGGMGKILSAWIQKGFATYGGHLTEDGIAALEAFLDHGRLPTQVMVSLTFDD